MKKYRIGLEHLERAVELDPKSLRYANNLATMYVDIGEDAKAITTLGDAHHNHASVHFNMAYLYSKRQRNVEAMTHVEMALSHDPNLSRAIDLRDELTGAVGTAKFNDVPSRPTWSPLSNPELAPRVRFDHPGCLQNGPLGRPGFIDRSDERISPRSPEVGRRSAAGGPGWALRFPTAVFRVDVGMRFLCVKYSWGLYSGSA